MMDWDICFDGTLANAPEVFQGKVGLFSFEYVQGQIRHVRWREAEIVRRIYATVRDPYWGTVPLAILAETIDDRNNVHEESIRIQFSAVHQSGSIDYRWQGLVDVHSDGTLAFSFRGISHTSFLANRVGLCILHPVETLAGRDCRITDGQGNVHQVSFRKEIQPDNPATDIAQMHLRLNEMESVTLSFEGELFETEDQRNWIDDSFKTFCTPLSRPKPFALAPGDIREQSIQLKILSSAKTQVLPTLDFTGTKQTARVTIALGDTILPMRHRVGLGCGKGLFSPSDFQLQQLQSLRPNHIRVDVHLGQKGWQSSLSHAVNLGNQLESELEIAVHLHKWEPESTAELVQSLQESATPVCRCCVYGAAALHLDASIHQTLIALHSGLPKLPVYTGTLANLAELNRLRPSWPELSGLCFAAQPQEHAFDNASLIETPRALGQAVTTASRFAPGGNVCVGPMTLRRQFDPSGEPIAEGLDRTLPATVDPRQMSLLGAAWTLACLKHLAESGATASTWFEPAGWKGIMADRNGSPLPHLFSALPDTVYPIYHVLADWCSQPAAYPLSCCSSNRLLVECAARQTPTLLQLMIVNLRATVQRVRLPVGLGKGTIRPLDSVNYSIATADPSSFRNGVCDRQVDGNLDLELPPFAYHLITFPR